MFEDFTNLYQSLKDLQIFTNISQFNKYLQMIGKSTNVVQTFESFAINSQESEDYTNIYNNLLLLKYLVFRKKTHCKLDLK